MVVLLLESDGENDEGESDLMTVGYSGCGAEEPRIDEDIVQVSGVEILGLRSWTIVQMMDPMTVKIMGDRGNEKLQMAGADPRVGM